MDKKENGSSFRISGGKRVALLLDPDFEGGRLKYLLKVAIDSKTDFILVGGSLTSHPVDELIDSIKKETSIPVILFPGNLLQLTVRADAIFFLSLLSGRNPEFLIGNHVIAAPFLKAVREKVFPAGYILVGCGNLTSVEYMSQTSAIPCDKPDIVTATALAGEMLGMKLIYLEAGSGAGKHVPEAVISQVRQAVSIPVVVGGGIRSGAEAESVFRAGADMVVLGNGCEENPDLLRDACRIRDTFNRKSDRTA